MRRATSGQGNAGPIRLRVEIGPSRVGRTRETTMEVKTIGRRHVSMAAPLDVETSGIAGPLEAAGFTVCHVASTAEESGLGNAMGVAVETSRVDAGSRGLCAACAFGIFSLAT